MMLHLKNELTFLFNFLQSTANIQVIFRVVFQAFTGIFFQGISKNLFNEVEGLWVHSIIA